MVAFSCWVCLLISFAMQKSLLIIKARKKEAFIIFKYTIIYYYNILLVYFCMINAYFPSFTNYKIMRDFTKTFFLYSNIEFHLFLKMGVRFFAPIGIYPSVALHPLAKQVFKVYSTRYSNSY